MNYAENVTVSFFLDANPMNSNISKPKGNSWAPFLGALEKLVCLPNFLLASSVNELCNSREQICEYVYPVEYDLLEPYKPQ